MIRLTLLFCLLSTVGEAQFTPVFNIPSNYSMFDIKAFEMNESGDMMIITEPYNGGSTINAMVYNSDDYGQTWDSTLFLNQSILRDNASVTEGGNLYFSTLINVYSTTNPPYQRKVLQSSLDGGVTWTEKTIDSINGSLKERSLSFINDSTGMFFYQQGMYLTNDYGQSWQNVHSLFAKSLGVLDDKFTYNTFQVAYTFDPISGEIDSLDYLPYCNGQAYQTEFHDGTSYRALRAWNGWLNGPQYNGNFASLNIDLLPLGNQKIVHFPQRYAFIDLSISNSCIHMVLDGRYVRSCDGGETFYDIDAFNGNINENVHSINFVNDTVGFIVSQNLITYEWHLWKTTNGGGSNGTQVLTNNFSANLDENVSELSFDLFPNPTSQKVNIASPDIIEVATVYSLDGKKLLSEKVNSKSHSIDLSSFSSGNYIIHVISEKASGSRKVIKK